MILIQNNTNVLYIYYSIDETPGSSGYYGKYLQPGKDKLIDNSDYVINEFVSGYIIKTFDSSDDRNETMNYIKNNFDLEYTFTNNENTKIIINEDETIDIIDNFDFTNYVPPVDDPPPKITSSKTPCLILGIITLVFLLGLFAYFIKWVMSRKRRFNTLGDPQ